MLVLEGVSDQALKERAPTAGADLRVELANEVLVH